MTVLVAHLPRIAFWKRVLLSILSVLLALYVSWRLILPLSLSNRLKIAFFVILLVFSQHHLLIALFWGTRASPEIPAALILFLGWVYASLLIGAALFLLLDLSGLLVAIVNRPLARQCRHSRRARTVISALALGLAGLGVWQAVRIPEVKKIDITLPDLALELDGLRIVQLSDLHASRLLDLHWIQAVVKKTNDLKPDLIVITGDLVDGTVENRRADVAPLQWLRAPLGVYAVSGNHEYYAQYPQWIAHFKSLGLRLLLNEHELLTVGHQSIALAGVTDTTAARYGQATPDLQAALKNIPEHTPIVLLGHRPTGARDSAQAGVDLQLSGHTHGGQILGMHKLVQLANEGYVAGLYQVDAMQLYVSHGAGLWAGMPVRLGRASEITEIRLRSSLNAR